MPEEYGRPRPRRADRYAQQDSRQGSESGLPGGYGQQNFRQGSGSGQPEPRRTERIGGSDSRKPEEYGSPDSGPGKNGRKEPPDKKRKLLFGAAMVLSAVLVIYGLVRLVGYGADWLSSRQTSRELREISEQASTETAAAWQAPEGTLSPAAEAPFAADETEAAGVPTARAAAEKTEEAEASAPGATETPAVSRSASDTLPAVNYPAGLALSTRVQALRKKSEYIVGWLTMDDLEEAVVLRDNSFFLNHDALGKRNDNGALFLDEDTELLTRPYTMLIYGHNMKTGAMFGNLKKYEQPAYLYQHRYMKLETLFESGDYEIFAASVISLTPGLSRYLSLSELQSPVRSVRRRALDTLIHLSSVPVITSVSEEDQVILLITCVGNDDERLVVAAKRLADAEQETKAAR